MHIYLCQHENLIFDLFDHQPPFGLLSQMFLECILKLKFIKSKISYSRFKSKYKKWPGIRSSFTLVCCSGKSVICTFLFGLWSLTSKFTCIYLSLSNNFKANFVLHLSKYNIFYMMIELQDFLTKFTIIKTHTMNCVCMIQANWFWHEYY